MRVQKEVVLKGKKKKKIVELVGWLVVCSIWIGCDVILQ
jgi:hypothetical protein